MLFKKGFEIFDKDCFEVYLCITCVACLLEINLPWVHSKSLAAFTIVGKFLEEYCNGSRHLINSCGVLEMVNSSRDIVVKGPRYSIRYHFVDSRHCLVAIKWYTFISALVYNVSHTLLNLPSLIINTFFMNLQGVDFIITLCNVFV